MVATTSRRRRTSPEGSWPVAARRGKRGLTMVELLVAMVILLVGIYAIAKGFPSLFRNIDAERDITEMVRLQEKCIDRLKDHPSVLPEVITGHDPATGALVHPDSEPDDTVLAAAGNSRDDLIEVLGEVFAVPGVDQGANAAVYPLNLGPAAVDAAGNPMVAARALVELERAAPSPPSVIPAGTFYVESDGDLMLPAGLSGAFVDYCYVDSAGDSHYAYGEYVPSGGRVVAAGIAGPPAFAAVVEESCRATGFVEYGVLLGTAADVLPGTCVVEQTYGATLLFDPAEAGRTMQVDYTLRTEDDANGNPRRALIVMEEVSAPTAPPYELDLTFTGLNDEKPLFDRALDGTDLIPDVYLLAVDLQTGTAYTDAAGDLYHGLDMVKGKATFNWTPAIAQAMRGHEFRLYYRTLRDHCVQVQKAPQYFVEDLLASQYPAAVVDYRTFSVSPDPGDGAYSVVNFPESAAGQAVAVDYCYGPASPYQRVTGELHVINDQTRTIVLNYPDVRTIVGVQGVSLKVRGWWNTERGQLQKLDLDTYLTPRKLLD